MFRMICVLLIAAIVGLLFPAGATAGDSLPTIIPAPCPEGIPSIVWDHYLDKWQAGTTKLGPIQAERYFREHYAKPEQQAALVARLEAKRQQQVVEVELTALVMGPLQRIKERRAGASSPCENGVCPTSTVDVEAPLPDQAKPDQAKPAALKTNVVNPAWQAPEQPEKPDQVKPDQVAKPDQTQKPSACGPADEVYFSEIQGYAPRGTRFIHRPLAKVRENAQGRRESRRERRQERKAHRRR